jgi:hypothetical protein
MYKFYIAAIKQIHKRVTVSLTNFAAPVETHLVSSQQRFALPAIRTRIRILELLQQYY